MQGIVNFKNIIVDGSFSFEIVNPHWTSEDLTTALATGTATISSMIDGGKIYNTSGVVIAKIIRNLSAMDFSKSELKCEKNKTVPYFFGFEDKDDVMSHFMVEDLSFFSDKKILLASRHSEEEGYGSIFIVLKNESNKLFHFHIEDTIRSRNGPTKFYADVFREMSSNDKRYFVEYDWTREYREVLRSVLTTPEAF